MKEREELFIPQIESSVKASADVDRRRFLQAASIGAASLVLPSRIPGMSTQPTARNCIMLVLVGGPSHLDTFDMKPDAPSDVRGPFRPIKTNVKGIEISEIFPRTAKHADKYALLRSLHHNVSADHRSSLDMLDSGSISTDVFHPSLAAVMTRHFDIQNGILPHTNLTGTCRRLGEGFREGTSGQAAFVVPAGYTKKEVKGPRWLPAFDSNRYGTSRFGRSCYRAIELIASGGRFVTIDMFDSLVNEVTWDIHGARPFPAISSYRDVVGPMFDHAYSALLEDLSRTGLLDTTLVVATGEFGRTPQINPCGGRDHWPHCWTALFAGGGVHGGQVVGESDDIGAYVRERPTTPGDVIATIYHTLGIDYRSRYEGSDIESSPYVPEGAKPILELF